MAQNRGSARKAPPAAAAVSAAGPAQRRPPLDVWHQRNSHGKHSNVGSRISPPRCCGTGPLGNAGRRRSRAQPTGHQEFGCNDLYLARADLSLSGGRGSVRAPPGRHRLARRLALPWKMSHFTPRGVYHIGRDRRVKRARRSPVPGGFQPPDEVPTLSSGISDVAAEASVAAACKDVILPVTCS